MDFRDRQLFIVGVFTASANLAWLNHKLAEHPRTGRLTILAIILLGVVSALLFGHCWPDIRGHYADQFVLSALGSLMAVMLWTRAWEGFLWDTGVARSFELGAYDQQIKSIFERIVNDILDQAIVRLPTALVEASLGWIFGPQERNFGLHGLRQWNRVNEAGFGHPFGRRGAAGGQFDDWYRESLHTINKMVDSV